MIRPRRAQRFCVRVHLSTVLVLSTALAALGGIFAGEAQAWTQGGVPLGTSRNLDQARIFDLGDGASWIVFEELGSGGGPGALRSVALDAMGQVIESTAIALGADHVVFTFDVRRQNDGGAAIVWREATPTGAGMQVRAMLLDSPGSLAWAAPVDLLSFPPNSPLGMDRLTNPVTVQSIADGLLVVSTAEDGQTLLFQLDGTGSLLTPAGGLGSGSDVAQTRLVERTPDELWLLELRTLPSSLIGQQRLRLEARLLDARSLVPGPATLVSRGSDPSAIDLVWRATADGEGGFWLAQLRLDPETLTRALYVEHVDAQGVGRWPTGGRAIAHMKELPFVELRPLGAAEALLAFSAKSYSSSERSFVFDLTGTDHLAWGDGAELIPAHGNARPQIRLRATRQLDLLWQRDSHEFFTDRAAMDSLVNTFHRGHPALSASSADRVLVGATESGPFGGVVFWGEPDATGRSFELRATVDGAIPLVTQPSPFQVWSVDERATIAWRSLGTGDVDVDLSLDDGATWQPLASSIPDRPDSLVFDVPDLPTEFARIRVRRVDQDLWDRSPSFRIRPLGPGYGRSVGDLRLAFDLDGQVRTGTLEAFSPRDVYLLARVDFGDIGEAAFNGAVGLGAWEAGVQLSPQILPIETELFGDGAVDVNSDPLQWSVGLSGTLPLGHQWVPLMRLRLLATAALDREVRVDLGASVPSSFDHPGGPGLIAGWLERPASGECETPCLRAFGGGRDEGSLALNPEPIGTPVVALVPTSEARVEQPFEVPLRLDWSSVDGNTPFVQANATIVLEDAAALLRSLRSDGPGELRYRNSDSMLSFSYRAPAGQTLQGEQWLYLGFLGGTSTERIRPQILDARLIDEQGTTRRPLVDVASIDVTREVAVRVQRFDVTVVDGTPRLTWEIAGTASGLRVVAHDAGRLRVLAVLDPARARGQLADTDYDPLHTEAYGVESSQPDGWIQVASSPAPVVDGRIALAVEPNPIRQESHIRFSLGRAKQGVLEVFDLRGRRVRAWTVDARAGGRSVAWDGRDREGRSVAAGTYFVRLRSDERVAQQKVLVLR